MYQTSWQQTTYSFSNLKELMAKATPPRSGDILAGVAASSAKENIAAKGGLSYDEAAFKLAWLMREAFRREVTGVELYDESHYQLENATGKARLT